MENRIKRKGQGIAGSIREGASAEQKLQRSYDAIRRDGWEIRPLQNVLF